MMPGHWGTPADWGRSIPTAEKVRDYRPDRHGRGANSWTDLYQAYHRLMAWHEHTNAIDFIGPNLERMRRYETELEENREMIRGVGRVRCPGPGIPPSSGSPRLFPRDVDRSLIVFNPSRPPADRRCPGRGRRADYR